MPAKRRVRQLTILLALVALLAPRPDPPPGRPAPRRPGPGWPGPAPWPRPSFQVVSIRGDVHVIPGDVHHPLGRLLDLDLFNVSALQRRGYGDARASSLPLIVQRHTASRPPALAGVTRVWLDRRFRATEHHRPRGRHRRRPGGRDHPGRAGRPVVHPGHRHLDGHPARGRGGRDHGPALARLDLGPDQGGADGDGQPPSRPERGRRGQPRPADADPGVPGSLRVRWRSPWPGGARRRPVPGRRWPPPAGGPPGRRRRPGRGRRWRARRARPHAGRSRPAARP